jgi:hypothetical protein
LASALVAACSPGARLAPADRLVADRALDYLESTEDEMGVDVLIVTQAFGELVGDARARAVVEARRVGARPEQLARYGVLLEVAKPPFLESSLAGVPLPTGIPDPSDTLEDGRVQSCVDRLLTCDVPPECIDYAELDAWGYVLTHQAVWLLIAEWLGCEVPVDVETLRHRYASRLVAETRFDPVPSDLFFERLAMLGHLGFAGELEAEWVQSLRDAQQPEGCFPVDATVRCHPHPTALALWSLAHAARVGR